MDGVRVGGPIKGSSHGHSSYIFERLRRDLEPPSPRRLRTMIGALVLTMMLCGWAEGSIGPLIPSLRRYYDISYATMSLINTTAFLGAITAGLTNVWLADRIGFGLISPLSAMFHALAYLLAGIGGPYSLLLWSFFFIGFGGSIQDAQVNNLASRFSNPTAILSIVQASFGLGATISPFLSTLYVEHVPYDQAHRYFFGAMGVAVFTTMVLLVVFQGRTEQQILSTRQKVSDEPTALLLGDEGDEMDRGGYGSIAGPSRHDRSMTKPSVPAHTTSAPLDAVVLLVDESTRTPSSGAKMRSIFNSRTAWVLMAWSFVYNGLEIALTSWLTAFLVRERGGADSAGNATTAFWAGMTIGRIICIPLTDRLGCRRAVLVYFAASLVCELWICFIHSLLIDTALYALLGVFLGPVYPTALLLVSELLDESLRAGVMGLMGSLGGAGGAVVPFITGAIFDKFGIWTLQPLAIALIAIDGLIWQMLPKEKVKP